MYFNKQVLRFFIFTFSVVNIFTLAEPLRLSSNPYVSGDTFRSYCDYIYDETTTNLDPLSIKPYATIFLKADYKKTFFEKIHPQIRYPYILITHNSAEPSPGAYSAYLEDANLIAWFSQNMDFKHTKLHPIPVGLANRHWEHGNIEVMNRIRELKKDKPKEHLLYYNIRLGTFFSERSLVYDIFKNAPYCFFAKEKSFEDYLIDVASSKFNISPRGYGLDTHRLWESLYQGSFPIVKSSFIDVLYEGLPIVIINDWHEITEDFLNVKYLEFSTKKYSLEKLNASYWFKLIDSYKNNKRTF